MSEKRVFPASKKTGIRLLGLYLLALALNAFGHGLSAKPQTGDAPRPKHCCDQPVAWYMANRFDIVMTNELEHYTAHWTFESSERRDLSIAVDEQRGQEHQQGQLILVSGRGLIVKGLSLEEGHELDVLDGPSLMYQLVVRLLERASPKGPLHVRRSRTVRILEQDMDIYVATTSAAGRFPVPWAVEGRVSRRAVDSVEYDLVFRPSPHDPARAQERPHFTGSWTKSETYAQFPDTMPLAGWKVYILGPKEVEENGLVRLDFGATAEKKTYATLGELRWVLGGGI
jgi:hypothetical protein